MLTKKLVILTFLLAFFGLNLSAQNNVTQSIKIPLQDVYYRGAGTTHHYLTFEKLLKLSDFLGMPTDWEEIRLLKFYFQRTQHLYQSYINGRITQKTLKEI